jgi:uncharacterized protein (DUF983 family)
LHRHPDEVDLHPLAMAELVAFAELQHRDVCPGCMKRALTEQLRRTCEECGNEYTDTETARALENL